MELRQLEYFVAVAEERHFTRAAHRLHIAQSGLSAAIRSLERDLGADLFIRSTRSVELTDAGRALLIEARHTLNGAAAAREAVAAVQGVLTGRLVIGTLQNLGCIDIPAVLARFHRAHPGVDVHLKQANATTLIEKVRNGYADLVFVSPPIEPLTGLDVRLLEEQPVVLACGPRHRLATDQAVELNEIVDETFVDFYPDWISRDHVDRELAGLELRRRVSFEVNDVDFLLSLVVHELGVALVPESVRHRPSTARFLEIKDPIRPWPLAVVTGTGGRVSAAARALLADPALRTI